MVHEQSLTADEVLEFEHTLPGHEEFVHLDSDIGRHFEWQKMRSRFLGNWDAAEESCVFYS